jgi:endonuclease/exonuclease/phosphatase family metal-dependent hydrolase
METRAAVSTDHAGPHSWQPVVLNRPPRAEQPLLKVVAFNAQGGRLLADIILALRRPPLASADVILLSEMDWRVRRSGRREVAAELAAALRMSFAYFGEFALTPAGDSPVSFMGNAILSSYPLSEVRVLPLTSLFNRRRVRRMLGGPAGIVARIAVQGRPVTLGIVHLNSRWNPAGRASQMAQYLAGFPHEGAAIIGGDFNTTSVDLRSPALITGAAGLCLLHPRRFRYPQSREPLFAHLSEAGFEIDAANVDGKGTFAPSRLVPPLLHLKLDWIALRDIAAVSRSAAVVPARNSLLSRRFSDHDFVMCTVEL